MRRLAGNEEGLHQLALARPGRRLNHARSDLVDDLGGSQGWWPHGRFDARERSLSGGTPLLPFGDNLRADS